MIINSLDKIRVNEGNEKCKEYFYNTFYKNKREAVELINDGSLTFPCFYLLLPMVSSLGFYQNLNIRNKLVINIMNQMVIPETYYRGNDYLSEKSDEVYPILKWMIDTGYEEEDTSDEYEQIMDIVATTLINVYGDNSIIDKVAEIIFKRNKKGKFVNDMVWAYFESKDINAIKLIAKRLLSDDNTDINLAKRLLNLNDIIIDKQKFYNDYNAWMQDNDDFLYFTEECNQFTSNPTPIKTDLLRKYLNKGAKTYKKTTVEVEDENEKQCLAVFSQLDMKDKALLSDFSNTLNKKDLAEWERWIHLPVQEQLEIAKKEQGDYYL